MSKGNTGRAVGGGEKVWFLEVVAEQWPDLAELARQQRGDRYTWLVKELEALGDERATAIVEEYQSKLRQAARDRAQRDRKWRLAQYEEQVKTASGGMLQYLEKSIAKLKRQIEKADQRH